MVAFVGLCRILVLLPDLGTFATLVRAAPLQTHDQLDQGPTIGSVQAPCMAKRTWSDLSVILRYGWPNARLTDYPQ